jgi:hypothetical protein
MIPKARLILHLGIGGLLAAWRLSREPNSKNEPGVT